MTVWNSLLLAAAVSAFSIILLIYAKRHKAGIPVPVWTIRYGAALAFVGLAAVALFSSYLRTIDPNAIGESVRQTPFFWLVTFSVMPATCLSLSTVNVWAKQTMPPRRWLTALLYFSVMTLVIGGFTLMQRAINAKYNAIELHSQRGHEFFEAGRDAEAIPEYRKVLALDPISPYTHLRLGIALYHLDMDTEAVEHLNAAIENEPKYYFGGNAYRAEAERYLSFIHRLPFGVRHISGLNAPPYRTPR